MRASTTSNKRGRSRQVRSHRPQPHALAWRSIAVIACFGFLGCQSCLSGEPAREEAPRSPTPPPQAVPPRAETLEGEADNEKRREEPAGDESGLGAPATGAPAVPRRAAPSSAAKPSTGALREQKAGARARTAPAPEEAPAAADDEPAQGRLGQPQQLMERLDRAMRSGAADCPSAEARKKAVCDLAGQICQLVDRDPNVASVLQYCADAKERCSEASRRTRERCER